MKDWYDEGIGSEKMKRDIAKSARVNPVTFPCLDPEGCKHFKNEIKLCAENKRLKEEIKQAYNEGLRAYAWWKDGVQYVGSCGATLKEAMR